MFALMMNVLSRDEILFLVRTEVTKALLRAGIPVHDLPKPRPKSPPVDPRTRAIQWDSAVSSLTADQITTVDLAKFAGVTKPDRAARYWAGTALRRAGWVPYQVGTGDRERVYHRPEREVPPSPAPAPGDSC